MDKLSARFELFALALAPFYRYDNIIFRQKSFRDIKRSVQYSARVIPEVEYKCFYSLLFEFSKSILEIASSVLLKFYQLYISYLVFYQLRFLYAVDLYHGAFDRYIKDLLFLLSPYCQRNHSPRFSPHKLYRFAHVHVTGYLTVYLHYLVCRHHTCPLSRRSVDGRYYGQDPIPHRYLYPQPAELAFRLYLYLVVLLRLHKLAVIVERLEHTLKAAIDHLFRVYLLDIVDFHYTDRVGKELDLIVKIVLRALVLGF